MTEYIKKEDAIEALMCYFIPPIYTGEQVDQAKNIAESIMDGVPTIEASEDCIDKYSALAELDPLSYEYKEIKELPSVVPSKAEPNGGKWIPLNAIGGEPEDNGEYLLQLSDGFITSTYYDGKDWELWADAGEPVAWQPLPAPYKESDNE